jgi:hypothetical protein
MMSDREFIRICKQLKIPQHEIDALMSKHRENKK